MEYQYGSQELQPSRRSRAIWFWALVIVSFIVVGAFGWLIVTTKRAVAAAERGVGLFHERLAAGKYEAIYFSSVPPFQEALKGEQVQTSLIALHDIIGTCKTPGEPLSFFVNANTSGTRVRLRYRSECVTGPLDEALIFSVSDGQTTLAHYTASGPFLRH